MPNGVGVIIVSDRVESKNLTQIPTNKSNLSSIINQEPMTLAPSRLKNQMLLVVAPNTKEKLSLPMNANHFITKTCLTTYTYRTTYLKNNGDTTVESREKVISNIATEDKNYYKITPYATMGVTLTQTPELTVGVFPTTYYYYNTINNQVGGAPDDKGDPDGIYIEKSAYTVINTITGPEDYIDFLQPSESATPVKYTNTYYSHITLTKTILDPLDNKKFKTTTSANILTQIVITESTPAAGHFGKQQNYNVSVINKDPIGNWNNKSKNDLHIYATKSYTTTITYLEPTYSSLQQQQQQQFYTRIVENVITKPIPLDWLPSTLIAKFQNVLELLKKSEQRPVVVTLATLLDGQKMQITAMNILQQKIQPTMQLNQLQQTMTEQHQNDSNNSNATSTHPPQTNTKIENVDKSEQEQTELIESAASEKLVYKIRKQQQEQNNTNSVNFPQPQNTTIQQSSSQQNVYDIINKIKNNNHHHQQQQHQQQHQANEKKPVLSILSSLTTTPPTLVNNLLNNLNLKMLSAAVSELIQNNLIQHKNNSKNKSQSAMPERRQPITTTTTEKTNLPVQPVYIPIEGVHSNIQQKQPPLQQQLFTQSLQISPPKIENLGVRGIPISPGQLITTNSDIVIGRPNNGETLTLSGSLKFPPQSPPSPILKIGTDNDLLKPPPPRPLLVHKNLVQYKFHQNSIADYDELLRPPPAQQQHYFNYKFIENDDSSNYLTPPPIQQEQTLFNSGLSSSSTTSTIRIINEPQSYVTIPISRPLNNPNQNKTTLQQNQHENIHEQNDFTLNHQQKQDTYNLQIRKNSQLQQEYNINPQHIESIHQQQQHSYATKPQQLLYQEKQQLISQQYPLPKQHKFLILEQQQQQYSPIEIQKSSPTKKINSPSLVQYGVPGKDMPIQQHHHNQVNSSYHDVSVQNLVGQQILQQKQHQQQQLQKYLHIPLNHQQQQQKIINFDNSVLSHNINIQVPPLTFKQSASDYPLYVSAPVHGRPGYGTKLKKNSTLVINNLKIIPKIKIPLNEQQIQVKLTPASNNLQILRPTATTTTTKQTISFGSKQHNQQQALAPFSYAYTTTTIDNEKVIPMNTNFQKQHELNDHEVAASSNMYILNQQQQQLQHQLKDKFYIKQQEHVKLKDLPSIKPNADFIHNSYKTTKGPYENILHEQQKLINYALPVEINNVFQASKTSTSMPKTTTTTTTTNGKTIPEKHNKVIGTPTATRKILPLVKVDWPTWQHPLISTTTSKTTHRTTISKTETVLGLKPPPSTMQSFKKSPNNMLTTSTKATVKPLSYFEPEFVTTTVTSTTIKLVRPTASIKPRTTKLPTKRPLQQQYHPQSKQFNELINTVVKVPHFSPSTTPKSNPTTHATKSTIAPKKTKIRLEVVENTTMKKYELIPTTSEREESELTETTPTTIIVTRLGKPSTPYKKFDIFQTANTTTTTKTTSLPQNHANDKSIFIVLSSGSKQQQHESDNGKEEKEEGDKDISDIELDYDESITFEFPENISNNDIKKFKAEQEQKSIQISDQENNVVEFDIDDSEVLLGGVLISQSATKNHQSLGQWTASTLNVAPLLLDAQNCTPACKEARNEICTLTTNSADNVASSEKTQCTCRRGFARMFPDRPCKPLFTYTLHIPLQHQLESEKITEHEKMKLYSSAGNAVQRLIMKSDFRDILHNLRIFGIDVLSKDHSQLLLARFILQLFDHCDKKRLENVFKKQIRLSNFRIGGTDLLSSKNALDVLFQVQDFDECSHASFNDCSEHAQCYNLAGTYSCSCEKDYMDMSINILYTGRMCVENVGCELCNYHGRCENKNTKCKCFSWYSGNNCQYNMKLILLVLALLLFLIFVGLLICLFLTNKTMQRTRQRQQEFPKFYKNLQKQHEKLQQQSLINSSYLSAATTTTLTSPTHHNKMTTTNYVIGRSMRQNNPCNIEKQAIMLDSSSSEKSHNSLSYAYKDNTLRNKKQPHKQHMPQAAQAFVAKTTTTTTTINQPTPVNTSTLVRNFPEQLDRSLTVIIPRAKYQQRLREQQQQQQHNQKHQTNKLTNRKTTTQLQQERDLKNYNSIGALVSAGFEVSAIVSDNYTNYNKTNASKNANENNKHQQQQSEEETLTIVQRHNSSNNNTDRIVPTIRDGLRNSATLFQGSEYNTYSGELLESMDVWLDKMQQKNFSAEARSCDETTILPITRPLRDTSTITSDNETIQIKNEGIDMTERDMGSTLLMPHTQLYNKSSLIN